MRFLKSIRVQLILILCYLTPTLLLGQYIGGVFLADLRTKTETALSSSVEHACTLALQNIDRIIGLAKDATYDGELADVHTSYHAQNINVAEFLRRSRTISSANTAVRSCSPSRFSSLRTTPACRPTTAPAMKAPPLSWRIWGTRRTN